MQTVVRRPVYIAHHALDESTVTVPRVMHMQAHLLHGVGELGPGDSEVLQGPGDAPIGRGVVDAGPIG